MRKLLLLFFSFALLGVSQTKLAAQTTLTTTATTTGFWATTTSAIVFGLENTNSFGIVVTDIGNYTPAAHAATYTLWYHPTNLTGIPPDITVANGWIQVPGSGSVSGTTAGITPVLSGLSFMVPANTAYRVALVASANGPHYGASGSGPVIHSNGGVNIHTQTSTISPTYVGYFPGPLTTTPRGFYGFITFIPAVPCVDPPTPGTATVNNASPCLGSQMILGLSGNSSGTGQTYQWESSANIGGPYTSVGSSQTFAQLSTAATGTLYYRAAVTCGTTTLASTPVLVTVPTPFPGGNYTINSALATGGANFQTFTDAINALSCGIAGPIVLNVASGSGPYNEQINLPSTIGANATNTVTINGNGAILTMSTPSATNYATINLDGADYITIDNLTIEALGTNGFAVHLMNAADNNTFYNCTIKASPSAVGTTSACVSMSGATTVYSTAGANGMNNTFSNCALTGGYFGFSFYGAAPTGNTNNNIINCTVKDYYVYGTYMIQQGSGTVSGCTFERPTRPVTSTFYGVLLTTGCTNMLVEKNRIRKAFTMQPTSVNTAYALYCAAASTAGNENKFYNNVISDIEGSGTIAGLYLVGATHVKAYHNTVSLDYPAATGGITYGIYATGTAGVDIKNNIVSITRGGYGLKYCLYFTGAGKTSNNNDLYIPVSGTNFTGYYSADFATLANWKTANSSAYDQNSVVEQPLFTSPGNNDYTPGNSLLDNLGAQTTVTTDLLNTSRSATTPDLGAYEFTVPACSGTPTTGTATINGSATAGICLNNGVKLNLQGYSIGAGTTYEWESSPVGQNIWTPIANATNPLAVVTMTGPLDYRAKVTCGTSFVYSNVVSSTQNPFYICYCSPLTGISLQTSAGTNYTTNVTIPSTSLNSSVPMAAGGYTQTDYTVASNTATMFIGTQYTINATQSTATANSELWIDWDQSGTFDATEHYPLVQTSLISSANFTPPATALTGLTGLRVRTLFSATVTFGPTGACIGTVATSREIEDYVITVLPAPTCVAPSSIVSGGNTTTDITVNWTASVSNPLLGYEYYYSTANVAPTATTTPSGTVGQGVTTATITGLASGTPYYVWVRSSCGGNDYSIWAGPLSTNTLLTNDEASGAIPLTVNPDYNCGSVATGTTIGATQSIDPAPSCNPTGINDDVWYSFQATSTEHRVTLYGLNNIMSIALYTGSIGSLTQMPAACGATTVVLTAANLYATGLNIGTTYYLRAYTNIATVGTTSNFTICVGTMSITPPANDLCANSVNITNGQVIAGSQAHSTQSITSCNTVVNANDVWYHFTTGNTGGSVTVTVISTYADMVMEVLSGTCGGTMTGLIPTASTTATGSCLDGPAIGSEFGTYTVAANTTYYARVYGYTNPINNDQGTFTIQATGSPLTIKLAEISATNVGNRNRVDWSTASEMSGDKFDVQRSTDGRNYTTLATIEAKGTASTYSYWDVSPVTGKNYYRLYMKDAASNGSYSREVMAAVKEKGDFSIAVHPNPVTDKLQVVTYGTQGNSPSINVLDVSGKIIKTLNVTRANIEINMNGMAKGMYLIKYTDDSRTETIRVNKQ